MGLSLPHQVDLRHLVEMVLQVVHRYRLRHMPPVLPIPHLKIGEFPFLGQQDAERPLQVLHLPVRHLLPLKPQLYQLLLA